MTLREQSKEQIMSTFRTHSTDTGSIELQVVLLTRRIEELTEHLRANHKDYSSKQGLLKLVSQRRNFLKYLKKNNVQAYGSLTKQLGIK